MTDDPEIVRAVVERGHRNSTKVSYPNGALDMALGFVAPYPKPSAAVFEGTHQAMAAFGRCFIAFDPAFAVRPEYLKYEIDDLNFTATQASIEWHFLSPKFWGQLMAAAGRSPERSAEISMDNPGPAGRLNQLLGERQPLGHDHGLLLFVIFALRHWQPDRYQAIEKLICLTRSRCFVNHSAYGDRIIRPRSYGIFVPLLFRGSFLHRDEDDRRHDGWRVNRPRRGYSNTL